MDTMTFTKVAGAFCGALLVFLLGKWAAEELYHVRGGEQQAYVIDTGGSDAPAEEEEAGPGIIEVMASADPDAGAGVFRRCQACHQLEDGANATGPHLYAVVGREIAAADGFGYSSALSGIDGEWTIEDLDAFLANPSNYAPGTTMSFAGLRDIGDRADVIAYLDATDGEMTDYAALAEAAASAGGDADASAEGSAEGEAGAEGQEEAAAASDAVDATEEETTEGMADAAAEEEAAAEGEAATVDETAEGETDAAAEEKAAEGAAEAAAEDEAAEGETDAAAEDEAAEGETDAAAEDEAAEVEKDAAAEEDAPAAEDAASSEGDGAILASADPEAGARVFRQCQACHKLEDGANGVGPHLYGVVGREIGTVEGYNYSDALTGKDGVWDVAALDAYLTNPREWAPGTKMTYAGLRKDEDRANVIAYLDSIDE